MICFIFYILYYFLYIIHISYYDDTNILESSHWNKISNNFPPFACLLVLWNSNWRQIPPFEIFQNIFHVLYMYMYCIQYSLQILNFGDESTWNIYKATAAVMWEQLAITNCDYYHNWHPLNNQDENIVYTLER